MKSSATLRRDVNHANLTGFRQNLANMPALSTGAAHEWRQRVLVGKQGKTGEELTQIIERGGHLPSPGPWNTRLHHHPSTGTPSPGHTIRFNRSANDEVWYGLCCSEFQQVHVYGETGVGCQVQWLEVSHRGKFAGENATFYEAVGRVQPQLLPCMRTWGDLLLHDVGTGFFVLYDDPKRMRAALGQQQLETKEAGWHQRYIEERQVEGKDAMSEEEAVVFEGVFRSILEYPVDGAGREICPSRCSDEAEGCVWGKKKTREFRHQPLITREGPVFLRPVEYHCTKHNKYVSPGHWAYSGGERTNIDCLRIGNMHYETDFLPELQAGYVDTMNIAACRRRIHDRWLTSALAHVRAVKSMQGTLHASSTRLQYACRCLLALSDFLPSADSLANLQLLLFQQLVLPRIPAYDAAVAAFDGQLVRIDATFKFAATVLINDPSNAAPKKRRTRRVGSAVLVAVGLEGMCLTTPKLVPGENNESIQKVVAEVLTRRRSALGSLSAPAGFVSDCIRQAQGVLWKATQQAYPEFAASIAAVYNSDGQWKQDAMLMLQDISHRQWAFTRKAASKKHPDYQLYKACITDVFHQLRVPHDHEAHGPQALSRKTASWQRDTGADRSQVEQSVRRSVLDGAHASALDDGYTHAGTRTHTHTHAQQRACTRALSMRSHTADTCLRSHTGETHGPTRPASPS